MSERVQVHLSIQPNKHYRIKSNYEEGGKAVSDFVKDFHHHADRSVIHWTTNRSEGYLFSTYTEQGTSQLLFTVARAIGVINSYMIHEHCNYINTIELEEV